ncbi:alpha/beta fold hydrolase [Catellatospora paridis]|uniref:alpha/beta fold hydrolase n=1 Tax=Catellatospora paridis TaxID=1617086 RepID=UPI0012D3CF97|nr:alpha/beta hydrolase [Catellatospora paridis]
MGDALAQGTHTTTVYGIHQRFHVAGRGPVCVVHPGGPGVHWDYLRMPELEQHLRLVYIEPIGTGRSGRLADPRDYRFSTYVSVLDAVVSTLGRDQVFLLGHGHGGLIAQRYGLDHPDRVAGLVLYATSPVTDEQFQQSLLAGLAAFPTRHPRRREQAAAAVRAFEQALTATDDQSFTRGVRGAWPAAVADYWAHEQRFARVRTRTRGWVAPWRARRSARFDVRSELGRIQAPTLVLAGAHDPFFGPRWATMLHEGVRDSGLLVFTDSGNLPHLEQPAAFTGAVADFVHLVGAQ